MLTPMLLRELTILMLLKGPTIPMLSQEPTIPMLLKGLTILMLSRELPLPSPNLVQLTHKVIETLNCCKQATTFIEGERF